MWLRAVGKPSSTHAGKEKKNKKREKQKLRKDRNRKGENSYLRRVIICHTSELKTSPGRGDNIFSSLENQEEYLWTHTKPELKSSSFGYLSSNFPLILLKKSLSTLPSRLEYVLPSLSPLPLIQAASMISHYPLATILPWPPGPHHHCPDLDCTLLLEGEGGVALQRYQPRSPESTPRHWVSMIVSVCWNLFLFLGSTGTSSLVKQSGRCWPSHEWPSCASCCFLKSVWDAAMLFGVRSHDRFKDGNGKRIGKCKNESCWDCKKPIHLREKRKYKHER